MKKTITHQWSLLAYTLGLSICLFSCKKEHIDVPGNGNPSSTEKKLVIRFNHYAGDSMHYDNKGRISESWMGANYGTYYEYSSPTEVIIKNMDRVNMKLISK